MNQPVDKKNSKLALKLGLFAILMFGFGYLLIPFYDTICCLTGLNGKKCESEFKKPADFTTVDKNRDITVEFITTLNNSMPMEFKVEKSRLKVHPGEYQTVNFYAENKTDKVMVARAVPSFAPGLAAEYFKKIECFCFTEQTFKAHEGKTMPVRFAVSADLPEQYKTITLSYTFFDITEKSVK